MSGRIPDTGCRIADWRRLYLSHVLTEAPDGVIVAVWVVPGSSRDGVGGIRDGMLRVRTTAPAEAGRANRAVARLVGAHLGSRRAEVITGHTSRSKRVLVVGVTLKVAQALLAEV